MDRTTSPAPGRVPAAHIARGLGPCLVGSPGLRPSLWRLHRLVWGKIQELPRAPDSAPSPRRRASQHPLSHAYPGLCWTFSLSEGFQKFPSALLITTSGHDPKRCPLRETNSDDSNAKFSPHSGLTLVLPEPQNRLRLAPSNLYRVTRGLSQ